MPRVFNSNDPLGKRNRDILNGVIHKVEFARELRNDSEKLLCPDCQLEYDTAEQIVETCTKSLSKAAFSTPLDVLSELVSNAENMLTRFKQVNSEYSINYLPVYVSSLENLDSRLQASLPLTLLNQPERYIREGAGQLLLEVSRLELSLDRVTGIANRRALKFDGSPSAIASLGQGDGIDEILPGVKVDSTVLEKAKQAAEFYLSDVSIGELDNRQHDLHRLHERISRLLYEIEGYANKLGLPFDSTQKSIEFLSAISKISSIAPSDLLDYRHAPLANPLTLELLSKAEEALSSDISQRQTLSDEFYLDVLPELGGLKAAILTFRRSNSFFNIFNGEWRAAKKLFNSVSKTKVKCKAAEYEAKMTSLVCWIEHRTSFISNEEFKKAFGPLFKGLDTDFSKIRRLHNWYNESQAELLKHPGFIELVDLTSLSSQTINQLGALSSRLVALSAEFDDFLSESRQLLENVATQMDSVLRQSGWNGYNQNILLIADGFRDNSSYLKHFVKPYVSPNRSVDVLNAPLCQDSCRLSSELLC